MRQFSECGMRGGKWEVSEEENPIFGGQRHAGVFMLFWILGISSASWAPWTEWQPLQNTTAITQSGGAHWASPGDWAQIPADDLPSR